MEKKRKEEKEKEKMLSEETRTVETRGYYQINEKISESAWKAKKLQGKYLRERERERDETERAQREYEKQIMGFFSVYLGFKGRLLLPAKLTVFLANSSKYSENYYREMIYTLISHNSSTISWRGG